MILARPHSCEIALLRRLPPRLRPPLPLPPVGSLRGQERLGFGAEATAEAQPVRATLLVSPRTAVRGIALTSACRLFGAM